MDDIRYVGGKSGYHDAQAFSVQGSAPGRAKEEKPWRGDFSAELTPLSDLSAGWTLYVDDSLNKTACGAGVVLEGPGDLLLEQALKSGFKATNNQAEYETLLARLNLAYDMSAREVT